MRILHYFLGFPPYRSGGLTKFAYDLMLAEAKAGHEVAALWPGRMGRVLSVRKGKEIKGIESYELCDPLPVPLDEGILEPGAFMESADPEVYRDFLQALAPEVIHVHTLMGLHKEFLTVAHELGIRVIMTTHDYFGLCFKTNMYYRGVNCPGDCSECAKCNISGLSIKRIRIMQSGLYRNLKDTALVKALRKRHRTAYFGREDAQPVSGPQPDADETENTTQPDANNAMEPYRLLRRYYHEMLSLVDVFHFNSKIARDTYVQALALDGIAIQGFVIPITHAGIKDHRALRDPRMGDLRLTYLGSAKEEKGYDFVRTAVDEANEEAEREIISLQTYLQGYAYAQLPQIMAETDVLIVPSLWRETFGFTALEALTYGVPVICADTVGAAELIANGGGAVFKSGDLKGLKELLLAIDDRQLDEWNAEILRMKLPTMKAMRAALEALYRGKEPGLAGCEDRE